MAVFSYDFALFACEKNLEVMKKNVPLQSQMKNGWLTRPRVLDKTDALEIKIEKFFSKKFGD